MSFKLNFSSGRILNRFTKDMGAIDERLPTPLINFINVMCNMNKYIYLLNRYNIIITVQISVN